MALVLLAMAAPSQAFAEDSAPPSSDGTLIGALKGTKPIIDMRYRFEWKAQDGFAEDAYANTLRTRLGFETGEFHHFKALIEMENVLSLGDDHFNSTTNGRVQYPVIADPDATELNRAQLTFTGVKKTPITIGRQRFNLNNQRFIGAVDFRQNQQTFDAVGITSTLIDRLTLDYLYIAGVQRVFGDDHPMGEFDSDSHVIAVAVDGGPLGTIRGYGVLLDLEEAPAASSATWGVRYENKRRLAGSENISFAVVAEYATQGDYASNPIDYRESYIHGEASADVYGITGKIGWERLGGDGVIGFSTPLATLHKFQGFADVFLTTPAAGLEDLYGSIGYAWSDGPSAMSIGFFATYHDFKSTVSAVDFGRELDVGMTVAFRKRWSAELKGAVYDGGDAGPADRNLIWASLRFQY